MKIIRLLFLLLFTAVPLFFYATQDARSDDWQTLNEDLLILASEFVLEEGSALTVGKAGLALSADANSGSFTSPPIKAPFPFNAVVPQWMAELPQDSSIEIHLRSGSSASAWSAWREIHPSPDMALPDEENIVGDMSFVPGAEGTHTLVQIMITLNRADMNTSPLLRELRLTFIDSTAGPTTEELVAMQQSLDQQAGTDLEDAVTAASQYPKPFVISRDVWCTSPDCDYSEGLEYQTVTHLVLHHTVGIPDGDSAAQMRAYWSYHTYTKGWGDLGYNYVIDLDGNIFEGHLGGDDVVGTHASDANAGSMGLAMIGSYSYAEPSAAVEESIIDMFAWKADQRDINVFDASDTLPNMNWGLPHIMGHRDVYGTTECPGTEAHSLIPAIRDEVASRIGLESPHIYVDELSAAFVKSSAYWFTGEKQCGHNTHAWHTWSTTDPAQAENWGEWRPEVPMTGNYQIEAHIPYCRTGRSETAAAHYTINHASGTSDVVVSHEENLGLWASLGEFSLNAGNDNVIHLTDLTTTDDGLGVWFDALRLLLVEVVPTAVNEMPNDNAWLNQRQVQFKWRIENSEEVSQTTFQVATDEQFENLVAEKAWTGAVENFTYDFERDYGALYWRVVVTSNAGDDYPSFPTRFGIDTEPPVSSVKSLVWLDWSQQYRVSWSGNDALSYIVSYKIEYREENGAWMPWLNGVSGTSAIFTPPAPGQTYEFRSQAKDALGNVEAEHTTADASTKQAETFSHAIILPVIYKK